jgi:hypothetical protein
MTEQITLKEAFLPERVQDMTPQYNQDAKVVCGECGRPMKNMMTTTTHYTKDDDLIGLWTYSCRVNRDGSAKLALYEDGYVNLMDELGEGHKIVETTLTEVQGKHVYAPKKDPAKWEEPE